MDLVEKKLKLTAKKSLLTTTLPILTDKTQAFPGMVVEGVILIINDKGVVVSFYNGVTVNVHSHTLSPRLSLRQCCQIYVGCQQTRSQTQTYSSLCKKLHSMMQVKME